MKKTPEILAYFDELHPDPKCALNFSNNFELLVAVVLSAQCTDERVNKVTPILFKQLNIAPNFIFNIGRDSEKTLPFLQKSNFHQVHSST